MGMKVCKQRKAKSNSGPHGPDIAQSRTGNRCTLLGSHRLGTAGVCKTWLNTNACALAITKCLTCLWPSSPHPSPWWSCKNVQNREV